MIRKTRFSGIKFSENAIRRSVETLWEQIKNSDATECSQRLCAKQANDEWTFDSEEQFFFSYAECDEAFYRITIQSHLERGPTLAELVFHFFQEFTFVTIEFKQSDSDQSARTSIQNIFDVLSDYEKDCRLPENNRSKPRIFIGHGHSPAWRELKDHLTDKHGYSVESYETGARAGHAVRDTLQSMLKESSFALLVLTKEDETKEGNMRARQNVIHETGLFQGKLGFNKAIDLVEEGTESFSNIAGIEQIRFRSIQETFGEVIATINRENG